MGSRSNINLAYIAGFLDGDGSLMIQIKKRKDGRLKTRLMFTICFYQDSRHATPLKWIRKILGIGYLSERNDGITELRINGYRQVKEIIEKLLPFIRFKKAQATTLHKAATLLSQKSHHQLTKRQLMKIVDWILRVQQENYVTRYKKSKAELMQRLDLTP